MEELDRQGCLAGIADARAEEWECCAPGPIGERVQQSHVLCIEEGHSPFLAIQEHSNPLGGASELQTGPGLGASPILVSVAEPQGPVTGLWAQLDPGLPVHPL